MATIKLRYVQEYRDRLGKLRRYVRRPGCPRVPLPGLPGSAEFQEAYSAALAGKTPPPPSRCGPGSFGALVTDYYRSVAFARLKHSTQATYRTALGPLLEAHGKRSVAGMDRDRVEKIITGIGSTRPGMANLTRAILHKIMRHAVKHKWRPDNPVTEIESYKIGTRHTWTDEELAAYEKRCPLGTRERLAYALLLYAGQRGGDVVKLRRSEIINGRFRLTQEKTDTELTIPVHPELARALRAGPTNGLTLIGDKHGKPVRRPTLTRLIGSAARAAGLDSRCKAHGLRKAAMRRLAERGASTKQIQSVSGHKTLKEVERYTAAASQARLAQSAIDLLGDEE
jgi:integrase